MSPLFLPDSEQALHEQTYHCNADPTEETESQRLSVLINLTILVFKPTAVIASTMKNLLNVFNGVNMSADTPTDVATVVMTDASTK